jgi:hypothetical protein
LKISTNIEEFECMEYVCDQIIWICTLKVGLLREFSVNFFMMYDIDIHQLNLEQFLNTFLLDQISFKKCVYLHFFNNECIIISSF